MISYTEHIDIESESGYVKKYVCSFSFSVHELLCEKFYTQGSDDWKSVHEFLILRNTPLNEYIFHDRRKQKYHIVYWERLSDCLTIEVSFNFVTVNLLPQVMTQTNFNNKLHISSVLFPFWWTKRQNNIIQENPQPYMRI